MTRHAWLGLEWVGVQEATGGEGGGGDRTRDVMKFTMHGGSGDNIGFGG